MKYKVGDTVIIRADLKKGSRTMLGLLSGMQKCVLIKTLQ